MATETVPGADGADFTREIDPALAARLHCLQAMCTSIAEDILTARNALQGNAEDSDVAYLVADALGRVGWMAEQASVVAGSTRCGIGGDAAGWMLKDHVHEMLLALKTEATGAGAAA